MTSLPRHHSPSEFERLRTAQVEFPERSAMIGIHHITLQVIASREFASRKRRTCRLTQLLLLGFSLLDLIGALSLPLSELTKSVSTMAESKPKFKLFDMPVSNNGARCRIILYKVSLRLSIFVPITTLHEMVVRVSPFECPTQVLLAHHFSVHRKA